MIESREMRSVYCDTMIALAKENPAIVDLEADLTAAHGMKPFQTAYPDRTFNVGVAEANMPSPHFHRGAVLTRQPFPCATRD